MEYQTDKQQEVLDEAVRERYLLFYPKYERDLEIYHAKYTNNQKMSEIAEEFYVSESTVYRSIKRVENFLDREIQLIPLNKLHWTLPNEYLLRGEKHIAEEVLMRVCISLYQLTGETEVAPYYLRELNRRYPGMRNKKDEIVHNLRNAVLLNYDTGKRVKIFELVRLEKNTLKFTIAKEAEQIIDPAHMLLSYLQSLIK